MKADPKKTSELAQSISGYAKSSPGYFADTQKKLKGFVEGGQLGIFANGYWGHPAYKLPPEANLMAVAHYLEALASQQWIVAVAESGEGSLCGCMYLQCIAKVPSPGQIHRSWGYVTNAYVEPPYRGKALGRRMLDLLIETARLQELEFLIVWPSERAVPFYQRAGFRPVDQAHAGPDDEPPLELVL